MVEIFFGDEVLIYLIGWIMMFLIAPFQYLKKGVGVFLASIVICYCSFIAFFRGDVGTDTGSYIAIFKNVINGVDAPYAEFGFDFLSKTILFIYPDPIVSVKIISLLFFGLMFVFLMRSSSDERFLLLSFLLPIFSYSYSMNVIRVGLAASISALILQSIINKGLRGKIKYFIIAISFQYTSIIIPFVFYFSSIGFYKLIKLRHVFLFLFLVVFFLVFYGDYVGEKLSLYQESESPSIYSGLVNFFVILIIFIFLFLGKLPKKEKFRIISRMGVFLILFLFFSRVSYAGLRLIDMLTFTVPFVIYFFYKKNNICFDFYMKCGFYISGLIISFNIYMAYLSDYGNGESPFLPYVFL